MIWKYFALSKMGKEQRGVLKGTKESVATYLQAIDLMVITLSPDYFAYAMELLMKKDLSAAALATFFIDFRRMCLAGMSTADTFSTLAASTTEPILKDALDEINTMLSDGTSLKTAFEKSRAFSSLVISSIDAAEKSGRLPEVLLTLSDYYKFVGETKKRILSALAYPALVMVTLTVASIIISTKLIPQLKQLLPEAAANTPSTKFLLTYAWFMQNYWGVVILLPILGFISIRYLWRHYSDKVMDLVYAIPKVGSLVKEVELAGYFMALGVYLKSGVVLNEAITNIHKANPTYMTKRFCLCRDYVLGGMSFWGSVKRDSFFPAFVSNNLRKGEEQGKLKDYAYEIYLFYEDKSRETIKVVVEFINPTLVLIVAAGFAFLVLTFFVPMYSSFGNLSDQMYK